MKQTVIGIFNSEEQAALALKEISFDRLANNEISILKVKEATNNSNLIKDLQGFVINQADFEIAEIGEAFIGGPIADKLKNSTAQSLKGALMIYGVSPQEALEYELLVKEGKVLVVFETNSEKSSQVANTLSEYGGKNISKWNKNLNHSLKVYKSP